MILVKTISAEDTHPLRLDVLRKDSVGKEVVWSRDNEPDTFHLGAFIDCVIRGIATYQREDCPEPEISAMFDGEVSYRLRGMAVAPDYERQGIASLILAVGRDRLLRRGVSALWCHARVNAVGLYEKDGWSIYGEPFLVEDVGMHRWMAIRLTVSRCCKE